MKNNTTNIVTGKKFVKAKSFYCNKLPDKKTDELIEIYLSNHPNCIRSNFNCQGPKSTWGYDVLRPETDKECLKRQNQESKKAKWAIIKINKNTKAIKNFPLYSFKNRDKSRPNKQIMQFQLPSEPILEKESLIKKFWRLVKSSF